MLVNNHFTSQKAKDIWRSIAVAVFAVCFILLGLGVTVLPVGATDAVSFVVTQPVLLGTVKLGEYPQTYVGDALNETLKNLGDDALTGKVYTSTTESREQIQYPEYAYNGKRYVKAYGIPNISSSFRDGTEVIKGETYFFVVEPIVWDIFQQDDQILAVAHDLLGAVEFVALGQSSSSWKESYMRNFFNNYFLAEAELGDYAQTRQYYASTNTSDTAGDLLTDKVWAPSYLEIQEFYPDGLDRVKSATDYGFGASNNDTYGAARNYTAYYVLRTAHADGASVCKVADTANNGDHPIGEAYFWGAATIVESFVPAFVLNETAIAAIYGKGEVLTVGYDGTDHIDILTADNLANKFSYQYYCQGEPVTAIKDAGEYTAVIKLGGYQITPTLTVTPREVRVNGTFTAVTRTYNRQLEVELDRSRIDVVGLTENDGVSLAYRGLMADKHAGEDKPVTVFITLQGENAKNYTLLTPQLTTTVNITPQTVSVSGITAVDKEYDNKTQANLNTRNITFTGMYTGDDLTVLVSGEYAQKTVGDNLTINLSLDLDGEDKGNYTIATNSQAQAVGNIKPRVIIVDIADQTVQVGDSPKALTAKITSGSLASGDKAEDIYALSLDTELDNADLPIGEYKISGTALDNEIATNYDITFNDGKYVVLSAEDYDALTTPSDDNSDNNGGENNWLIIIIIVVVVAALIGASVGVGVAIRVRGNKASSPKHPKNKSNK